MLFKIVALLDRPSTHSFGIVPFIIADGEAMKDATVIGFAKGPSLVAPMISYGTSIEQFVTGQDCHDVRAANLVTFSEVPKETLAAGWLGYAFEKKCRELGLPDPETASPTHGNAQGRFWIEPADKCFARLDRWVRTVASRTFKEKSRPIAELMAQCLPNNALTAAACWYTAEGEQRDLELRLALSRSRSKALTRRKMRFEFMAIVNYHLKTT